MKQIGKMLLVLCFAVLPFWESHAQEAAEKNWLKAPGRAIDISINGAGQGYVIGTDGTPWRWDKTEIRWRRMSGKFMRISAAIGNRPWSVDKDGAVYRYNGLWWEKKETGVLDVAADTKGNVYIAKRNGEIRKWYDLRSEWQPVSGFAHRLSLGPSGDLWALDPKGFIHRFDGKIWFSLPGQARDIAAGGTDSVMIVDMDAHLRAWKAADKRWAPIASPMDRLKTLALTPEGKVWTVGENGTILTDDAAAFTKPEATQKNEEAQGLQAPRLQVAASVPESLLAPVPALTKPVAQNLSVSAKEVTGSSTTAPDSGDPGTITSGEKIIFVNTRKSVTTLAIGADGSVFGLDDGGNVLRWSNTQKKFNSFPGTLVRLAVDKEAHPWGVSALGRVFRHDGQKWIQIPNATANDIAIGYDGTVLIADAAGVLYRLNKAQTAFARIRGNGSAIAVDPNGIPWAIRSDKLVQRCDGTPCKVLKQKALSLSIGPDGSVWIVSNQNRLMRLKDDGETFETVQTPGHTPWKVAVGPSGYPWVISDARIALASKYFERDEGADTKVAAATSGDTAGSGASSSVTTISSSAFTFSKNVQFETVSYTNLSSGTALLASDPDGVIWAHTSGGAIDKYSSSKKKLIDAETKFTSSGYNFGAFDLAPNGDIWAYVSSPVTGLYRERNKVLKKYSVSGLTAGNVAVSPDGTVYADFYTGSTHYIYTKATDSEVFKKFKQVYAYGIAIGPGDDLWIIQGDNYVYQWTGSKFEKRPSSGQKAGKIAISKTTGTVYISGLDNKVYKWNGTNNSFDKLNNVSGDYIAVDDEGRPWVNTDSTPTIKKAKD